MEAFEAVGGGFFLLVSSILSVRLLLLARRNRALPELLLGIAFLFGGTLGAVTEAAGGVMLETYGPGRGGAMLAVGKAFGLIGIGANCFFVWWVFRRDEPWAFRLVLGLIALMGAGYALHFWSGAFASGVQSPLAFWIEFVGRVVSPAWLGVEAALYSQRMSRRVKLGLGDPVVANRFWLWAVASCTGIGFLLTSIPPLYFDRDSLLVSIDLVLFSLLGLATSVAYWLAFFPPAAYRRWLTSRVVEPA